MAQDPSHIQPQQMGGAPPPMPQGGMPGMMAMPPQQGAPAGFNPAAEPEVLRNLMINYIPGNVDEMQLRQLFEMYGPIETIKIVRDRETRQSKGFGFVKYRFAGSATQALTNLNGYPLLNKRLKVAYAQAAEAQQLMQQPNAGGFGMPQQHPAMIAGMMAPQQQAAPQAPAQ